MSATRLASKMTDNNLGDDASEMENKVNETNVESNQNGKFSIQQTL